MALNWEKLIEERNAWVAHNFPADDKAGSTNSVFGVMEEVGELVHHHLKQDQKIRGTDEHHESEAKDAVGDITVYLLGVMNRHRAKPNQIHLTGQPLDAGEQLIRLGDWVGQLCYAHTKTLGYHNHQQVISHIVWYLQRYCRARGWNYEEIVQDTWDRVKQRDWIKYPDTGLPPKEELAL